MNLKEISGIILRLFIPRQASFFDLMFRMICCPRISIFRLLLFKEMTALFF